MKKRTLLRFAVCAAVLVFLASGCAKKPAQDTLEESSSQTAQSTQAGDASGMDGSGIIEESVSDSAIATPDATGEDKLVVTNLERIFFAFDSFTLNDQAKQTLENNARYLKANPNEKIRIEGHCDERGSDSYNLALGEKRARVAKEYLTSLGISGDRLSIISFGEEVPLDPASTETAWAKNRRAEFVAY